MTRHWLLTGGGGPLGHYLPGGLNGITAPPPTFYSPVDLKGARLLAERGGRDRQRANGREALIRICGSGRDGGWSGEELY